MSMTRDAALVRCPTCEHYAWVSSMRGVRDAAGEMHHPSCPTLPGELERRRELMQRIGVVTTSAPLGDAVFAHIGDAASDATDAVVLTDAHVAVQTVADTSAGSSVGKIAKGAVEGAAEGAVVGAVSAAVISEIAAVLAVDLDVAIAVAGSAATAIGVGAGAGAGLGSTLGPIGAVVGVIVGIIAALIAIGGAQGANAGWCDPAQGTLLLTTVRYYLETNPTNPLLSIMVAHEPDLVSALATALGPAYDWSGYERIMHRSFGVGKDGLLYTAILSNSAFGRAAFDFFKSLSLKGVSKSTAMKIVALFCDFNARVRSAEYKFTHMLPGPISDRKLGPRVFQNDGPDCSAWQNADAAAASAFFGSDISNVPISAQPDAGWNKRFHDAEKRGAKWSSVESSRYYKDLYASLKMLVDAAYSPPKQSNMMSSATAELTMLKKTSLLEKIALGAGVVGVVGLAAAWWRGRR